MNEHEELLAKALACLGEAAKIQDPGVRAKVLALAYHSQQVARRPFSATSMGSRRTGRLQKNTRPAEGLPTPGQSKNARLAF